MCKDFSTQCGCPNGHHENKKKTSFSDNNELIQAFGLADGLKILAALLDGDYFCRSVFDDEEECKEKDCEKVLTTASIDGDEGYYTKDIYHGDEHVAHEEKKFINGSWNDVCDNSKCYDDYKKPKNICFDENKEKKDDKTFGYNVWVEAAELRKENKHLRETIQDLERENAILKEKVYEIAQNASEMFLKNLFKPRKGEEV